MVTRSRVPHRREQSCLQLLFELVPSLKSGGRSSVGKQFQDAGPDE